MGTETKFNGNTTKGTSVDDICISKSSSIGISKSVLTTTDCTTGTQENGKQTLNGSSTANNAASKVPSVPIQIDENDVINGAKDLLKIIRPNWDINQVKFKQFTDGITNKLVGCFYKQTEAVNKKSETTNGNTSNGFSKNNKTEEKHSREENDDSGHLSDTESESDTTDSSSISSSSNVVLVRVYGNKTDLLIDRKAERNNLILMHSYGFAPPLYATFKNGLAYDYLPGVTLNVNNVLEPKIWTLVAKRMAEMHRRVNPVKVESNKSEQADIIPMLWQKTMSFLDLVPERFSDPAKHKRLEGTFLPIAKMREQFVSLYRRLEALNSPLVFAHNDILLGNVVYNEFQQTVNFIDYEYAGYNFQAFDIGNHFAEFAGVDDFDYMRYPGREFQYEWLRVYLEEYLQKSQISDEELHRLYVQVNQFSLAASFFWTIWCLVQAEHSTIDFDYDIYALGRYEEYNYRKDKFLALDINASS